MRRTAAFFLFISSSLVACSGDEYDTAVTDVVFVPAAPTADASVTVDPPMVDAYQAPEDTWVEPDNGPAETPDTGPKEKPDTGWKPEWTEHNDSTVESCLETFPALCTKLDECGLDDPITGFLGQYCPSLVDGNSGALVGYCEGVAQGVAEQAGGAIATTISDFLKGCVENYDCDPASLQKFGEAIGQIATLFGEGENADFTDALPVLLDLASMCGGLGGLLPF